MKKVIVRYISISTIENHLDDILNIVSLERKEKANHYRNKKDQLLSLGAGYLMAKYLPHDAQFYNNEYGKPYLENGPFFSLSHSGEYVVIVIDEEHEIGIDIQLIDEKNVSTIAKISGENLPTNEMFQLWSNKESLIKCMGSSIALIEKVPALPLIGKRKYLNKTYYTQSIIFNGYSLSITRDNKEEFEIELEEIKKED